MQGRMTTGVCVPEPAKKLSSNRPYVKASQPQFGTWLQTSCTPPASRNKIPAPQPRLLALREIHPSSHSGGARGSRRERLRKAVSVSTERGRVQYRCVEACG
jgi:hypothetical protein